MESAERRWSGRWREPIAGTRSAGYGVERYYYRATDSTRSITLDTQSRARGAFGGGHERCAVPGRTVVAARGHRHSGKTWCGRDCDRGRKRCRRRRLCALRAHGAHRSRTRRRVRVLPSRHGDGLEGRHHSRWAAHWSSRSDGPRNRAAPPLRALSPREGRRSGGVERHARWLDVAQRWCWSTS